MIRVSGIPTREGPHQLPKRFWPQSPSKSAADLYLLLQWEEPGRPGGSTQPCRQDWQLWKYQVASFRQPAWRRLCVWKPLLIYLLAGNNVAWFPGLQWNEANLSSHPACKIYLCFAKEKLCWGKTPEPSTFFQKTIQFSLLIESQYTEPGTFFFSILCYNDVLMQLMLEHVGLEQPSKKQNSREWRGGNRTTSK